MPLDRDKFKRLVHYVAWKAGKRDWFGAVKLYKVLWFAESRQYVLKKQSITGETYIREKHGPIPKDILSVLRELEDEGKLKVSRGGDVTRFLALSPPELEPFSKDEIEAVNYWIEHIDRDHTAESISELSHDYAWEIARMGEEIPMQACFSTRIREPRDKELEWARGVAEKLKLP